MAESLSEVPVPDKFKVFLGLITKEGRLRLYQSDEHPDFFGLLVGTVKNDPDYLEPDALLRAVAYQEAKRVGIEIIDFPVSIMYHAMSGDLWSFIIPVLYGYWKEKEDSDKKFLDIEPDDFDACKVLGLFEDTMHSFGGLVCFSCVHGESEWGTKAASLLASANPAWEMGLCKDPYYDLKRMREVV